jgi:1,4-alpha-glucan branching enzyme
MPTPALDTEIVLALDGYLRPDIPNLVRRHEKFRKWKEVIEQHEGGYDQFTKGYLKFGLHMGDKKEVMYREWAPNAKEAYLVGDFSKSRLPFSNLCQ